VKQRVKKLDSGENWLPKNKEKNDESADERKSKQ
jgi:hypothetical protein